MNIEQVQARRAIEALRAGVPSRQVVHRLGTTQEKVAEAFRSAMDRVAAGEAVDPIVIAANFGDGKSHLLQFLQDMAVGNGFVAAYLVVSPELPLGRPTNVLKAISESAEAPDRAGKALRALTADLRNDSEIFESMATWIRENRIDDRFRGLLQLYRETWADEELRHRILDDFEGKTMKLTDLRRQLKELNLAGNFEIARRADRVLAPTRLRLYAQWCRACTGRGLVVFFDELERLRRFSRKQRYEAYREVGWWLARAREAGSGILPVFAMTNAFAEETLINGLGDQQGFARASLEDSDKALGNKGLKLLTSKPFQLWLPTETQMADIRYRVRELYADAYGTEPPDSETAGSTLTMRSKIRSWITQWDLARYDPAYAAEIEARSVVFDEAEIPDELLKAGDEVDSNGGNDGA